MKIFEYLYLLGQPCMPYHKVKIRNDLKSLVNKLHSNVELLDIGARKSHYTIGINAKVWLLDRSRETKVQKHLGLGVTDEGLAQLQKRRSNVKEYFVQDFFDANLPKNYFDVITAIEVLEHIRNDRLFIEKTYQLLKPNGVFYLTTPNGITIENRNPDHMRHYTKDSLGDLLC